eukprot:5314736-Prymnesium_polylepis.1
MVYVEVERAFRALAMASSGQRASLLLQSGPTLHYKTWGQESAPPIVLLHDVGECADVWDEVAPTLSTAYRVIALHLRGHGLSSRSARRLYSEDALVEDLHALVVEFGLNGVDAHGAVTRPWHLVGRGLGAAVGCAYAARYRGRVGALSLLSFDPSWPKDRVCFFAYQAATFPVVQSAAAMLDEKLGLKSDPQRVARALLWRAAPHGGDEGSGWGFKMDPGFFLAGAQRVAVASGRAWSEGVAARCGAACGVTWRGEAWRGAAARSVRVAASARVSRARCRHAGHTPETAWRALHQAAYHCH